MTKEQKFLIELIIDDVARYLIEDTGLYYQSPAYCYEYLKHELKYGKAV